MLESAFVAMRRFANDSTCFERAGRPRSSKWSRYWHNPASSSSVSHILVGIRAERDSLPDKRA